MPLFLPPSHAKTISETSLTSAPRLGRGLVAGLLADGVRLPLVLGHAGVDVLDDIRADRGAEDLGEDLSGAGGLAIGADNGDGRSGGHLVRCWDKFFGSATAVENVSNRESMGVSSTELWRLPKRTKSRIGRAFLPGRWAVVEGAKNRGQRELQLKFCNIRRSVPVGGAPLRTRWP